MLRSFGIIPMIDNYMLRFVFSEGPQLFLQPNMRVSVLSHFVARGPFC